ncbi:MAG TPA: CoA transferase, partial [Verrucomicrobiae bacterium]|nr:CoA transferase [Verrucomicrobiae bacterium]
SISGEPDAPPTKCGVSIVDFSGGILSALALMIGLHRARSAGVGSDIDVSLLDTAVSMLNYLAIWTLNRDWRPQRLPEGAHQSLVPSQSFQTRDGWIVIMCMKEKFWERLVERLGLQGLRDDRRFRTFADRLAHRDALRPILRAEFLRRTTADWIERLRGQVPIAPVYAVEEALADEQVLAREMVIAIEHPRFGRLREVGCPIKVAGVAPAYAPAAPLGADTAAVLAEVGVDAAELASLRARGVV